MTNRYTSPFILLILSTAYAIFGGCAATTPPSNFYMLSALPESGAEIQKVAIDRGAAIGIGPINFPEYLDRSPIVTRLSPNKLKIGTFNRWAEPLKVNFSRVLMENLSTLLGTDSIFLYPWRNSFAIEYQIMVDVIRFDATADDQATLIARWNILGEDGKILVLKKKATFSKPINSSGYEAMVSALSQTLMDFSREIAMSFETISQKE